MKKIKILYIISLFAKQGGAERNLYDILCNIDKERFVPYVICLRGGELAEEIKSKGIHVETINLEKIMSTDAFKKGFKLFNFIRREQIQVVVTYHHDADIWGGAVAMMAGVPVVISSRRDLGYQLRRKHIWAYRILNKCYTRIITVSDAVKNKVVKREWTNPDKITTIYNGLASQSYHNVSEGEKSALKRLLGIDASKTVMGMVAAFRPVKGHIYLVKALAEIVKKNKNVVVVVAGFNDTQYFSEVKQLMLELMLEDYFIFTGTRTDIDKLLSVFDIFVLPSLSEGFSNALLEAMAASKPVIVTDSGGNAEAVIHNKTGLLIPPCDSNALATALLDLLNDRELRNSMGSEGLKRVNEIFTLESMIRKTEELYEYLLLKQGDVSFTNQKICKQKIRHSAKLALSHTLYYSGIISIRTRQTSSTPRILAYHSINKVSLKSLEIEQEPENFEQQMTYLKKTFHIISLSEFIGYKVYGAKLPENAIMVTLDDGYRDNYTFAFPIFKRLNIPASIFLTTDPIETKKPLFYDALRYAVINTSRMILDLRDIGLSIYCIDKTNEALLSIAIRDITEFSKQLGKYQKDKLINTIYHRLDMDMVKMKKNNNIYLSWDEITEMAHNGIEFGAHTKTHPQLSALNLKECKEELIHSKRVIEEHIGKPVRALAYPFGGRKDFSVVTEKAAQEAGYECAFSLSIYDGASNFTIGRKMVDSCMSSDLFGNFCKPLFVADLMRIYQVIHFS